MKLTGALVVALALVVGVVPQFMHCKTRSMVASGAGASHVTTAATTAAQPMHCYWSARAEIGVALPLAAAGLLLLFSRRKESRRALWAMTGTLGAVAMLIPTVLIGVCPTPTAVCRTTMRPTLLAAGGLIVALSVAGLVVNELRRDDDQASSQITSREVVVELLAEALLVACAGGLAGAAIAALGVGLFHTLIAARLGVPFIYPSSGALAGQIASGLALALIVVGLAAALPALRMSRQEPALSMRD